MTRRSWVDPDDAPKLTDEFFARADEYRGGKLVRRGRPKLEVTKERITIRLSPARHDGKFSWGGYGREKSHDKCGIPGREPGTGSLRSSGRRTRASRCASDTTGQ